MVLEAVKVALDPSPAQERLLLSHAGAKPEWSFYSLVRWWNANKDTLTVGDDGVIWWRENSKEAYSSGLEALAKGLSNWSKSRRGARKGRRVGFPRFKAKDRATPRFAYTTGGFGLIEGDPKALRQGQGQGGATPRPRGEPTRRRDTQGNHLAGRNLFGHQYRGSERCRHGQEPPARQSRVGRCVRGVPPPARVQDCAHRGRVARRRPLVPIQQNMLEVRESESQALPQRTRLQVRWLRPCHGSRPERRSQHLCRRECPGDRKRARRDQKSEQPARLRNASPSEVRTKCRRKRRVRLGAGVRKDTLQATVM